MNKNKIKIKHLIGMQIDLPGYPSQEDICYAVSDWYYRKGGANYIENHTSVDVYDNPVFAMQNLTGLIDKPEKVLQERIDSMVDSGILSITKSTQHRTYYRFETNDYE